MGRTIISRKVALELYIVGVAYAALIVLGVCCLAVVRLSTADRRYWLPYAVFFLVIGFLCNRQSVYFTESNVVVMGTIGQIATVILLPIPIALLTVAAAKALSELYLLARKRRRSWRALPLNIGSCILASSGAGLAFLLFQGNHYLWSSQLLTPLLAFPALIAAGVAYHLVDTLIITGPVTLTSGEHPVAVFVQINSEALLPELSLIAVGMIFAVLFHFSKTLSLLIVVPVFISMQSFGAVARLRRETVEAVLKMAESIDYRDTGTYEHSERLADLTTRLATEVGLTPEHIKEVVLASRVHDLGKIGISNDILLKQGPLTHQERQIMEEHPVIGASILASYSSFKESVDIVRHHHERWDGKGYPDGLKGEDIPVGSRIITVVDSFDAMTSDRPYRKGMTVPEAVRRLKDAMGTQFDPRICASFIQMLIEDGTYVPDEPLQTLHLVSEDIGSEAG